jgi:hypothetical protein
VGLCFAMQRERQFSMGVIIIKGAKNDVEWWKNLVKIGEILMFYYLKPWQSWQVVSFSFICMLRSLKQQSICYNFKFRFRFIIFESEHHKKKSILQRIIKRIHIIIKNRWELFLKHKHILLTFKKHSYPKICGIVKLYKFKELYKIDLEFKNFKSPLPHINGV